MAAETSIEWTHPPGYRGATWNALAGCSLLSPGCKNCYAMRMAARLEAMGQAKYAGTTKKANGKILWTGKVNLDEAALQIPLKTKTPTAYFVNSMSDLFHEDVPDEFIDSVFRVMIECNRHIFQVLTKRADRMSAYCGNRWGTFAAGTFPPATNIWLGVSCEDQQRADERIPLLLQTPAAVRFLSCEPLLGPIDLHKAFFVGDEGGWEYVGSRRQMIQWCIVGGESGPGARACDIAWIRSLIEQCKNAGTACFVKQLGKLPYDSDAMSAIPGATRKWTIEPGQEASPEMLETLGRCLKAGSMYLRNHKGADMKEWPYELCVREYPTLPGVTPCP